MSTDADKNLNARAPNWSALSAVGIVTAAVEKSPGCTPLSYAIEAEVAVPDVTVNPVLAYCLIEYPNWHCIAGVYNGNAYLYVDDMTTAAQSNTSRNSTLTQVSGQYIRIGLLGNQSSTYALEGGIGMVMIYSKGLTTTELLQNYNATKHNFI